MQNNSSTKEKVIYCKIACLPFRLGKKQEAYYWLGEALSEYFLLHTALFELLPELKTDPGYYFS